MILDVNNLGDFILNSRRVKTLEELFLLYEKAVINYGFDHLLYAVISDHPLLSNNKPLGINCHSGFNGWEQHYIDQNYVNIDLAFAINFTTPGVISWNQLEQDYELTKEQETVFREAEEAQLYQGVDFSIHGPDDIKTVMIACSSDRKNNASQELIDTMHAITHQFHLCHLALANYQPKKNNESLSLKEKEILKWLAKGLTKSDIGEKLNMSSHTVDYYTRRLLVKLDAKNVTAAVVTAIKEKLILI